MTAQLPSVARRESGLAQAGRVDHETCQRGGCVRRNIENLFQRVHSEDVAVRRVARRWRDTPPGRHAAGCYSDKRDVNY